MTNLDIIEFIDEFLSEQEDVLHGNEGRDCTKSRKYLDMIKKQLSIHGVLKSFTSKEVANELKDCETIDDAIRYFEDM
jgi:hypothetical protein